MLLITIGPPQGDNYLSSHHGCPSSAVLHILAFLNTMLQPPLSDQKVPLNPNSCAIPVLKC